MLCHPAGSSESAVPFKKLPAGAQSLYVVSSLRENDERTGQLVSSRSPYGVSVQQWLNSKMVGQEEVALSLSPEDKQFMPCFSTIQSDIPIVLFL